MTSEDKDFARKLTAYLDDGTANLKAGTAYKLQLARQQALARLAPPERSPALAMRPALAGAGGSASPSRSPAKSRSTAWLWLGILLIVAGGFVYQQWRAYQFLSDLEETDAAILSSDLPIDAYLDRGFQNWLKSAPE